MRNKAYTATGEQIISYGWSDVVKKFIHSDVTFTNVFYIPILVNNFYNISHLCCQGWDINIKHSEKTIFSINNRVIGYADKTQGKYVMRFWTSMPKLHALAKPIKDISTCHGCVAHLGYQNLLWITKYILGIEEISGLALNEIYEWCMMVYQ